jgi:hypothetical protein
MLALPGTRQMMINKPLTNGDQQETLLSQIAAVYKYINQQ